MIKLGDGGLNAIYPVGSIYTTSNSTNPTDLFGGIWKLLKTYHGGELIAFGYSRNNDNNDTKVPKQENLAFSDSRIKSKIHSETNYIEGILSFDSGTFKINTKNIVGMVEAIYMVSGLADSDCVGLWFLGNYNSLPNGVTVNPNSNNLLANINKDSYGGSSNVYQYTVTTNENVAFYINPSVLAYNGAFTPGKNGTKCSLNVKVFAKNGITYAWKRIA